MRSASIALLALCMGSAMGPAVRLCAAEARRTLELRATVVPTVTQATVAISGAETPFRKQTTLWQGKFKFSDLAPGMYTVTIVHPKWGTTTKTVPVTESFADKKGRVEVLLTLEKSEQGTERALLDTNTVSARELSVSPEAEKQYREGRKKLGEKKIDEAVRHLEKAVEISPEFVDAWNELGTVAYQTAKYEQAEKYFREALKHDPESFSPLVNLGGTLVSMNRFQDALPINRKAVEMRSDDALANSQLGINCFYVGELDDARKYLTTAKTLDPSHFSQPQIFLAEVYGRLGLPEKAVAELRDFLERNPDSPRKEDVRNAIERIEKAMKEGTVPKPQ